MAGDVLGSLRPRPTSGRLAAGAIGGIAGGLLFGLVLLTDAVLGDASLEGRGLAPMAADLLGTGGIVTLWAAHAAMSIAGGLVFAAVVAPRSYRAGALWGLVYGALLWGLVGFLGLRALTGTPLAFDTAALYTLGGHLLYGLGLGLGYVGFHHEEVRDAGRAESARWRAWAAREGREE